MNKKSSFIRRRGMWSFLAVGFLIITILSGVGVFLARKNNVLAAPDNPADVPGLFHSNPASTISTCVGQSECFAFTINTRLDESGGLTGTTPNIFLIPTSNPSPFNWTIDWGDGGATQTVSGTGASNSAGIPHIYSAPGEYRITILPNGTAANGWFKAFGFWTNTNNGANANPNKYKFRSINTPFTTMMRRNSSLPDSWDSSFARIFYGATNGLGIPTGLFDSLNTTNGTSFSSMFADTFSDYAYNSTTGTIPAGLFDSIDTTNGTNFSYMFASTFSNYAYNSTTGTIPTGLFDSIDTTNGTSFGSMFRATFSQYARNSTTGTIPTGLFDSLNTTNGTNFVDMFVATFYNYAYNSTTGTIPAGLFDSLNTTNGTDFSSMFASTFLFYAYNSTTGTIPAGLFDSIDTTNGTSFDYMFAATFSDYAYNSTTGTIPAGLFDSIDTTNGTNFSYMFGYTFSSYAYNSTTGTIPAGLFDSLNTTNGTDFGSMFDSTFSNYAYNSTTGTIPAGLFDSIDTTNGTNFSYMFGYTFSNYARRTATFGHSGATLEDQLFINVYSVKIGPSGAPTDNPVITAGAKIYPTYSASARNITAPVGSYTWYRTDGTSCSVTTPTPDCGEQTASTLATFPNDTEWTPETSTEKGNVTFYPQRITDINISTITVEDSIYSGDDVATFTPTTSLTETGFTYILVPYEGNSYDNDSFIISGSTLRLNTTLNHLAKPNYTIYVQVTDSDGNTFHKQFTLNVSHVEIPPETLPPSPGTPSAPDIPISLPDITAPNTGYLQIGNQVYDKTSVMIVLAVTAIVGAGYTVSVISRRQKATANVRAAKQRRQ